MLTVLAPKRRTDRTMATKSKTKNKRARARARKVKESRPDTRFFLDWDMMDNELRLLS